MGIADISGIDAIKQKEILVLARLWTYLDVAAKPILSQLIDTRVFLTEEMINIIEVVLNNKDDTFKAKALGLLGENNPAQWKDFYQDLVEKGRFDNGGIAQTRFRAAL